MVRLGPGWRFEVCCALCSEPAVTTWAARGPTLPPVPLCRRCRTAVAEGRWRVGWCHNGMHYGPPGVFCRRHNLRFVRV